ncbi:MAG TPA: Crp/Fnr family transcriptional regulator [Trebonia sp.]|jgi:CRP-like cAMP-binding protein|nr:Crp/Fnr family transcriptional regulator [Trebonia sp.]
MRVTPPAAASAHASLRSLASAAADGWPTDSFIATLPDAQRTTLLRSCPVVRFGNDEVLLLQGDVGDFLYVLIDGKVKVLVAAESGAETMLAIRSRGDLVGEFALLDAKPRTATARAIGAVTARRVSRADFADFAAAFPELKDLVFKYVLGKMRATTARRAADRVWGARERLAQELYDLAKEHGEADSGGVVRIPITQAELGQLAGVAVSTTERVLKEFRVLGIIATRYGATEVRNLSALEALRFTEEDTLNP